MNMLLARLRELFRTFSENLTEDLVRLRNWFRRRGSLFRINPRRYKIVGVILRWTLILSIAIPWGVEALSFAEELAAEDHGDASFELDPFLTYLRFTRDVLRYKIFEDQISCSDCPPIALIDGEKEPLDLKRKDIDNGSLKERFYRYQILVTGEAEVVVENLTEPTIPEGNESEKAEKIQKVKFTVNPDTLVIFEPDYVGRPFRWLFEPEVFVWVAIVAFAFWAGFQVAALYVNFVFEVEDLPSTRRFLLQYAFGSRYPVLRICGGAVIPEDENKFVARVGGPGRFQIDHDSVGVFERRDGSSRIEGRTPFRRRIPFFPLRDLLFLMPFERLRIALPTRSQIMNISLDHRTRDGIPLNIRNIEARFNIARDGQMGTRENPAAFDPEAVRELVYTWGHTVKLRLANLVRYNLRIRLMKHTFTELFAVIGAPDRTRIRLNETQLRELAIRQGGIPMNKIDVAGVPESHARTEITRLFFEQKQSPVEIQWINVGTWRLPSELLVQRHEEAWRITHENLRLGKKPVLKALRRKAYREDCVIWFMRFPSKILKTTRSRAFPLSILPPVYCWIIKIA